jgi:hypothetical protein
LALGARLISVFSLAKIEKAGRVARGRAQVPVTALEGKLERRSRREPPALQVRQRRRIFCQLAEKNGAGASVFAAGTALACERATVIVVCLACRTRVAIAVTTSRITPCGWTVEATSSPDR